MVKNDNGAWVIDPAELHRVFLPIAPQEPKMPFVKNDASHRERIESLTESDATQREIQILREALKDAREDRDKWRDMAERLSIAPPSMLLRKSQIAGSCGVGNKLGLDLFEMMD